MRSGGAEAAGNAPGVWWAKLGRLGGEFLPDRRVDRAGALSLERRPGRYRTRTTLRESITRLAISGSRST